MNALAAAEAAAVERTVRSRTPAAHKLARVLWHLLKYKEPFNPEVFAKEEEKMKRQKLRRLETMATSLNCRIVPNQ